MVASLTESSDGSQRAVRQTKSSLKDFNKIGEVNSQTSKNQMSHHTFKL